MPDYGARSVRRGPSVLAGIVSAIAAVCLAVSLVAAGFAVCAVPDLTTRLLSMATSNDAGSPFSKDELVHAAVATKDYTVGAHDEDALELVLRDINRTADTGYSEVRDIFDAPEELSLPTDAMDHLDDVYGVVSVAEQVLKYVAIAAVAGLALCALLRGRRRAGGVLIGAGVGVIACFAALGAWAALDFNGLFAAMHSLFFAAGTWTFSYDSLLIRMYPIAFWMGMGIVWLAVTGILSIAAIVVGAKLRRR